LSCEHMSAVLQLLHRLLFSYPQLCGRAPWCVGPKVISC
jgi:hypothetical protein